MDLEDIAFSVLKSFGLLLPAFSFPSPDFFSSLNCTHPPVIPAPKGMQAVGPFPFSFCFSPPLPRFCEDCFFLPCEPSSGISPWDFPLVFFPFDVNPL